MRQGSDPVARRAFLRAGLGLALGPVAAERLLAQAGQAADAAQAADSLAQGSLRDPSAVGRSHRPTSSYDNDPEIKAVELKLACRCGCTLDVYTCRTTDFTCTYSPQMHREVIAYYEEGKRGQQILDAFVATDGEKVLMAPKAEGFNLAGYLVPGIVVTLGGGLLAWVIGRRHRVAVAGTAAAAGGAGPAIEAGGSVVPGKSPGRAGGEAAATPEEMERLRRALSEIED